MRIFRMAAAAAATALMAGSASAQWYSGGNLHRASGQEWVNASTSNRLATAADFAATSIGERRVSRLGSMSKLLPYARDMKDCIDEALSGSGPSALRSQSVSEMAAVCYMLMQSDWERTLP